MLHGDAADAGREMNTRFLWGRFSTCGGFLTRSLGLAGRPAQGGLEIRRRLKTCPTLVALLAATAAFGAIDSKTYVDEIKYLSSPELKGRATPSPELEKAASYIAARFKSFGLKPLDGKSYEQPYTVHAAAKLGPNNHLSFEESGKKTTLKLAVGL